MSATDKLRRMIEHAHGLVYPSIEAELVRIDRLFDNSETAPCGPDGSCFCRRCTQVYGGADMRPDAWKIYMSREEPAA